MWYAQDVDNIFAYNGFTRFEDRLTKVMNTHAIKFGLVVERGFKNQNFQHHANIQYNYAPWGYGSTGNDVADILAGRPANAVVGQPSAIGLFKAWNIEAFAQDSWKIRRNFTLEYGLRFGVLGGQHRGERPRRDLQGRTATTRTTGPSSTGTWSTEWPTPPWGRSRSSSPTTARSSGCPA